MSDQPRAGLTPQAGGPDRHPEAHESYDVQGLHAPIMREKADPRDGYEPVPIWLVSVFSTITFFAGFYLARYGGDFKPDSYDERLFGTKPAKPKEVNPVELGKKLYSAQACVTCHQATGEGQPGNIPPLKGSEWVMGSKAHLARILLNGINGPLTVNGQPYNGNMPAFGTKLKDDQIAAVLTYIRQEWGNQADPLSPADVTAARDATKSKTGPWSGDADLRKEPETDAGAGAATPDGQAKAASGSTGEAEKASGKKADGTTAPAPKAELQLGDPPKS